MSCDFEALYYTLKEELISFFKDSQKPTPRVKLQELRSSKICGLADLAKMLLYFESIGIIHILNKDEHFHNWEFEILAHILDMILDNY